MLFAARCRAALLVFHVFFIMLVCSVYFTIPTGQRDAVCCTLSCCAAGFACFFIMLVCSVYFTIPTGQRDAVGCTMSCCAAGFACFFLMLVCSIYFTIPTGQRDAVCCTLSCCAAGFACFFYYVSMLSIFHNSNGAARCCWLHAVVLRFWFCIFFLFTLWMSE